MLMQAGEKAKGATQSVMETVKNPFGGSEQLGREEQVNAKPLCCEGRL